MSRSYDEYCTVCGQMSARINDDRDFPRVLQCTYCGMIFKIEQTRTMLKTRGTDEKAWKKALSEAYR